MTVIIIEGKKKNFIYPTIEKFTELQQHKSWSKIIIKYVIKNKNLVAQFNQDGMKDENESKNTTSKKKDERAAVTGCHSRGTI